MKDCEAKICEVTGHWNAATERINGLEADLATANNTIETLKTRCQVQDEQDHQNQATIADLTSKLN